MTVELAGLKPVMERGNYIASQLRGADLDRALEAARSHGRAANSRNYSLSSGVQFLA